MPEVPAIPTIMIVDDTPDNLQLLRGMFDPAAYRVVAFPSGKHAIAAAIKNPPDIILLDINMPEMNGFEVCERLKADKLLRDIPIIFVSALSETKEKVCAFTIGGVDYITKPFQIEEVLARVRTHLDLCHTRRELKLQNEILHENLRLRELVDQISKHDMKSPLTVFLNIPEMLMAADNLSADQKELLQLLSDSGQRMFQIIRRSLDLIKIEKGTYVFKPAQVDVFAVANKIFAELTGLMTQKKLQKELFIDSTPASETCTFRVMGEEFLIYSILSNLIKNAVEASPEGSTVSLSLISHPIISVSIHNSGAIPPLIRDRFFDRYVTSGKESGTGLGAYSARLMARALGGDLSFVTNDAEGTTLTLSFQVSPDSDAQTSQKGSQ